LALILTLLKENTFLCTLLSQVMYRELIPHILNVSRECLSNGNSEVAIVAFEIFDELVESPVPVLGPSISSIVQFSLEVCANRELELNVRNQVCFFLVFNLIYHEM
jgi:hypothetical protein